MIINVGNKYAAACGMHRYTRWVVELSISFTEGTPLIQRSAVTTETLHAAVTFMESLDSIIVCISHK